MLTHADFGMPEKINKTFCTCDPENDVKACPVCVKNQAIDEIAARPVEFDVEKVASAIHRSREWQALHLAVQSDILEDAKKRLAVSIIAALPRCLKDAPEGKGKRTHTHTTTDIYH